MSFRQADSAARAVIAAAGATDPHDCVIGITRTDSSVILDYMVPDSAFHDTPLPGVRVMRVGGGIAIEVHRSGKAKWLWATQ